MLLMPGVVEVYRAGLIRYRHADLLTPLKSSLILIRCLDWFCSVQVRALASGPGETRAKLCFVERPGGFKHSERVPTNAHSLHLRFALPLAVPSAPRRIASSDTRAGWRSNERLIRLSRGRRQVGFIFRRLRTCRPRLELAAPRLSVQRLRAAWRLGQRG
ncbi:hypothetical protein SKAU_G00257280 [Synaphobranchus kaupii]|uniref:Uncharacterized protein n=1 Tax=Synaphobranchus kaupii TaxID=118154 RepID=A0A9Q1F416_SYNKA|nr:hypothetical protein SKAU_G00257280 [Synaphobranchus kaupii]